MTDVHSPETRIYNMSMVRSKNTKPEILVRKYLFSEGFRYRLYVNSLPGKPDIVLPKYKAVIFINGCFWHGHNKCKYSIIPKTRTKWWLEKIGINIKKDRKNKAYLIKAGWKVITIWGCQLRKRKKENTFRKLKLSLLT